jgi:hypothetical protein
MLHAGAHGGLSIPRGRADTQRMARLRLRRRAADLAVTLVAVALCAAPLLPQVWADSATMVQRQIAVNEQVAASSTISEPWGGSFAASPSGKSVGAISWSVFTTNPAGYKLVLSTTSVPAMHDRNSSNVINDQPASPAPWSVAAGDRRFGFSAVGPDALHVFSGGSDWRGFEGVHGIEASHNRDGAAGMSTTTVRVASEMRSPLESNAKLHAWILATATVNI